MVIVGESGSGKTTLVKVLPAVETAFLDLEAGMKSVQDWRGDSIPVRCFEDMVVLTSLIGGPNPAAPPTAFFSNEHYAHYAAQHPDLVAMLARKSIIFVDSITDLTRQAMVWQARRQTDCPTVSSMRAAACSRRWTPSVATIVRPAPAPGSSWASRCQSANGRRVEAGAAGQSHSRSRVACWLRHSGP